MAYYLSGFVQEIAVFQFRGNANHGGQHLTKILGRIGPTPLNIAIDVSFGDVNFVRTYACERLDHA
jgi:hypothetical protein